MVQSVPSFRDQAEGANALYVRCEKSGKELVVGHAGNGGRVAILHLEEIVTSH